MFEQNIVACSATTQFPKRFGSQKELKYKFTLFI